MPRPLNGTQLLEITESQYTKLERALAPLSPEQLTAAPVPGEWSIKDVLAHLYEWQQMFFSWYEAGLRGEKPDVPALGYKWSQLPALNQAIYQKFRDLPLDEILALFRESHQRTIRFIETQTDADLTAPGLYPWMNQNALMSYLNSIAAAHYDWAIKEFKKCIKAAGAL